MPLAPKTLLGSYEILGPLGAGGMGEVYRAKDPRLGREVAIKVLPAEVASSPDRLARLEREARTVAGLNHPNIVVLYSIEEQDGIRFLTMELIDGQPLSNLVTPGGLPLSQTMEVGIRIADALNAAHQRGVVHRDLKPGNVMMSREGRVKVLDFGIAKVVAADQDSMALESTESSLDSRLSDDVTVDASLSLQGQVMGTVPYMAPEQVRADSMDARSDLFALGIILYELATGSRPFTGETRSDVANSILKDSPPPLRRIRSDLPLGLEQLVNRCLEKDPRKRIRSALDVANELRSIRRAVERAGEARPEKIASIAVLPFANRSGSAEDDYFSDGLADELLNVLAKVKGLRVSARSSSFKFRDATVAEVGQALSVATVLEGSVRKAGNRVRISVQLLQVTDGSNLWSETYDRTLDDIFAVQDDIAQSVVKELRTTLLGEEHDSDASVTAKAEVARAARGRSTNHEAQRLYLLARHLIERSTREDVAKGVEYLKEALALDPEFALAWAEWSRANFIRGNGGWTPWAEVIGPAREGAERALSLEPDLTEGHSALGLIQMSDGWDFRAAEASFAKALELEPGNATALRRAAILAYAVGRLEEAIELDRRAVEQDPLSGPTHHNLGLHLYAAGRLAEAEAAYRKTLELTPQRAGTRAMLSTALATQGRLEEALAVAVREPDDARRLWALAIVHHAMGHEADSQAAIREMLEKYADDWTTQIALMFGACGDVERAFEWLERAYTQRDSALIDAKSSPWLQSLHGDPRRGTFLKKMGFED